MPRETTDIAALPAILEWREGPGAGQTIGIEDGVDQVETDIE